MRFRADGYAMGAFLVDVESGVVSLVHGVFRYPIDVG